MKFCIMYPIAPIERHAIVLVRKIEGLSQDHVILTKWDRMVGSSHRFSEGQEDRKTGREGDSVPSGPVPSNFRSNVSRDRFAIAYVRL